MLRGSDNNFPGIEGILQHHASTRAKKTHVRAVTAAAPSTEKFLPSVDQVFRRTDANLRYDLAEEDEGADSALHEACVTTRSDNYTPGSWEGGMVVSRLWHKFGHSNLREQSAESRSQESNRGSALDASFPNPYPFDERPLGLPSETSLASLSGSLTDRPHRRGTRRSGSQTARAAIPVVEDDIRMDDSSVVFFIKVIGPVTQRYDHFILPTEALYSHLSQAQAASPFFNYKTDIQRLSCDVASYVPLARSQVNQLKKHLEEALIMSNRAFNTMRIKKRQGLSDKLVAFPVIEFCQPELEAWDQTLYELIKHVSLSSPQEAILIERGRGRMRLWITWLCALLIASQYQLTNYMTLTKKQHNKYLALQRHLALSTDRYKAVAKSIEGVQFMLQKEFDEKAHQDEAMKEVDTQLKLISDSLGAWVSGQDKLFSGGVYYINAVVQTETKDPELKSLKKRNKRAAVVWLAMAWAVFLSRRSAHASRAADDDRYHKLRNDCLELFAHFKNLAAILHSYFGIVACQKLPAVYGEKHGDDTDNDEGSYSSLIAKDFFGSEAGDINHEFGAGEDVSAPLEFGDNVDSHAVVETFTKIAGDGDDEVVQTSVDEENGDEEKKSYVNPMMDFPAALKEAEEDDGTYLGLVAKQMSVCRSSVQALVNGALVVGKPPSPPPMPVLADTCVGADKSGWLRRAKKKWLNHGEDGEEDESDSDSDAPRKKKVVPTDENATQTLPVKFADEDDGCSSSDSADQTKERANRGRKGTVISVTHYECGRCGYNPELSMDQQPPLPTRTPSPRPPAPVAEESENKVDADSEAEKKDRRSRRPSLLLQMLEDRNAKNDANFEFLDKSKLWQGTPSEKETTAIFVPTPTKAGLDALSKTMSIRRRQKDKVMELLSIAMANAATKRRTLAALMKFVRDFCRTNYVKLVEMYSVASKSKAPTSQDHLTTVPEMVIEWLQSKYGTRQLVEGHAVTMFSGVVYYSDQPLVSIFKEFFERTWDRHVFISFLRAGAAFEETGRTGVQFAFVTNPPLSSLHPTSKYIKVFQSLFVDLPQSVQTAFLAKLRESTVRHNMSVREKAEELQAKVDTVEVDASTPGRGKSSAIMARVAAKAAAQAQAKLFREDLLGSNNVYNDEIPVLPIEGFLRLVCEEQHSINVAISDYLAKQFDAHCDMKDNTIDYASFGRVLQSMDRELAPPELLKAWEVALNTVDTTYKLDKDTFQQVLASNETTRLYVTRNYGDNIPLPSLKPQTSSSSNANFAPLSFSLHDDDNASPSRRPPSTSTSTAAGRRESTLSAGGGAGGSDGGGGDVGGNVSDSGTDGGGGRRTSASGVGGGGGGEHATAPQPPATVQLVRRGWRKFRKRYDQFVKLLQESAETSRVKHPDIAEAPSHRINMDQVVYQDDTALACSTYWRLLLSLCSMLCTFYLTQPLPFGRNDAMYFLESVEDFLTTFFSPKVGVRPPGLAAEGSRRSSVSQSGSSTTATAAAAASAAASLSPRKLSVVDATSMRSPRASSTTPSLAAQQLLVPSQAIVSPSPSSEHLGVPPLLQERYSPHPPSSLEAEERVTPSSTSAAARWHRTEFSRAPAGVPQWLDQLTQRPIATESALKKRISPKAPAIGAPKRPARRDVGFFGTNLQELLSPMRRSPSAAPKGSLSSR